MEKEKLQNIWWLWEQDTGCHRRPIVEGKGQVWEGKKEYFPQKGVVYEGEEWSPEGMENEEGLKDTVWRGIVHQKEDLKLREGAERMGTKEV